MNILNNDFINFDGMAAMFTSCCHNNNCPAETMGKPCPFQTKNCNEITKDEWTKVLIDQWNNHDLEALLGSIAGDPFEKVIDTIREVARDPRNEEEPDYLYNAIDPLIDACKSFLSDCRNMDSDRDYLMREEEYDEASVEDELAPRYVESAKEVLRAAIKLIGEASWNQFENRRRGNMRRGRR